MAVRLRFVRILPVTIITAVLFLGVKIIDVTRGTEALSESLLVSNVSAEQPAHGEEKPAEPKKEEKKEETKKEEPKKEEAKPEEKKDEKKEDKKEEKKEEKKEDKSEEHGEGGEGEGAKKEEKNPAVSDTPGDVTKRHFSQSEVDLLQKLSRRREELDRWERNVQVKEAALTATEKRIDDKIQQIEDMKKAVAELLAQYNTQEETKIKSLVKIYEAMKPGDAARIFDEIEMPVLLIVIDKMAEKKAAPILAQMNSKKAKQVTVELAEQRRLGTTKLNSGVPPKPLP